MSQHSIWFESNLECQPLDTVKEINTFLFNPPAWRSLCEPLRVHSKQLIRNCELNSNFDEITLEKPVSFCHFDPEKDPVSRHYENTLPKTLICHDMANGYHDDCAIDGTANFPAYTFYNWAGVDIFCYFSHHLVTIPPLGWINVAHRHGVKVIGTLITEWAEGAAYWSDVLDSDTEIQNMASALVTIAKTLKFEGWLLNIENKISRPDKLLEFVKLLHKMLHDEIPNAELIWYDSVTEDGHLNWQNKLAPSNRVFFDACDGIFTNYSWSEQDVRDSVSLAAERRTDVYVGIDVWGRNFYGGGMFNTQQAVKLINNHGLSLAIFAPAWTHEALDDETFGADTCSISGEPLSTTTRFLLRDRALWGSLWPYLNTRVPCQLPFQTSFCRGLGPKRRIYGEVLCNTPWYNLRHMQYQPNSIHGPHGFLLSTREKIRKVSRHAMKDGRGNMKYRQSLYDFNNLMYEEALKIIEKQEVEEVAREAAEEEAARQAATTIQHSLTDIQSHKEKKFKNVLKNIFRFKKNKSKEQGEHKVTDQAQGTTHEAAAEAERAASTEASSRYSLMQMPVKLQLGQAPDKRLTVAAVPDERECLEVFFDDCFNGGSCLKINPSDAVMHHEEQRMIRLFHCDFTIEDTLVVCVVTKHVAQFPGQYVRLQLEATDEAGAERLLVLVARPMHHSFIDTTSYSATFYPIPHTDPTFKELQSYLVVHEPGFYVPIENSYGWKIFYFQMQVPHYRVRTVALRTGELCGALLLGHVALCARATLSSRVVSRGTLTLVP